MDERFSDEFGLGTEDEFSQESTWTEPATDVSVSDDDLADTLQGEFSNVPNIVSAEEGVNLDGNPSMTIVHLDDDGNEHTQVIDLASPELNEEEAREITNKIRTTTNVLYLLIARAHAGKAHLALGYSSFEAYIKEEFNYSKSYAYKLLNQANVIKAIEEVAPEGTQVYVSDATARGLKASLNEFVPELEERLQGATPDSAGEVIEDLIQEYKERQSQRDEEDEDDEFGEEYYGGGNGEYSGDYSFDDEEDENEVDAFGGQDPAEVRRRFEAVYNLYSALTQLTQMPPIEDIIETIPVDRRPQVTAYLETAIPWLQSFQEQWTAMIAESETEGEDDEVGYDDETDVTSDDEEV